MQYYRGSALPEERLAGSAEQERNTSAIQRIGKVFLYPIMLIFWIIQDVIHKSVEEDVD